MYAGILHLHNGKTEIEGGILTSTFFAGGAILARYACAPGSWMTRSHFASELADKLHYLTKVLPNTSNVIGSIGILSVPLCHAAWQGRWIESTATKE